MPKPWKLQAYRWGNAVVGPRKSEVRIDQAKRAGWPKGRCQPLLWIPFRDQNSLAQKHIPSRQESTGQLWLWAGLVTEVDEKQGPMTRMQNASSLAQALVRGKSGAA